MATAIKECRVCGKMYEACHTERRVEGVYNWQEVACSPECGSEYLAKVLEARGESPKVVKKKTVKTEKTIVEDLPEPDEDIDDDIEEDEIDDYFDDNN